MLEIIIYVWSPKLLFKGCSSDECHLRKARNIFNKVVTEAIFFLI